MTERIFTIGHSTHPIDEFVRLLTAHGVLQVVDVRTINEVPAQSAVW